MHSIQVRQETRLKINETTQKAVSQGLGSILEDENTVNNALQTGFRCLESC